MSGAAEQTVDLSRMASAPAQTQATQTPSGKPNFRMLFDFMLSYRPGQEPISFNNYHSIIMAEFLPTPDLVFSVDVNPTPRFFELDYTFAKIFTLRVGKIWIPFNSMNDSEPHSLAGGWYGTSRLFSPSYLPDVWADLGIGLRIQLVETSFLDSALSVYAVNGFRSGGTDPLSQLGTTYPTMNTLPLTADTNTDKALGGRLTALFGRRFGLGASFYTGRWTADSSSDGRLTIIEGDAQLRLGFFDVRAGYMTMICTLPSPANPATMHRPGFYSEAILRMQQNWRVVGRYGTTDTDSRILNSGDRNILGGALVFDKRIYQVSVEQFFDLTRTADKTNYSFTAIRFFLRL